MNNLTADDFDRGMQYIADSLFNRGTIRFLLCGSGVGIIGYGVDYASHDFDMFLETPYGEFDDELKAAISDFAANNGYTSDWMNDAPYTYMSPQEVSDWRNNSPFQYLSYYGVNGTTVEVIVPDLIDVIISKLKAQREKDFISLPLLLKGYGLTDYQSTVSYIDNIRPQWKQSNSWNHQYDRILDSLKIVYDIDDEV